LQGLALHFWTQAILMSHPLEFRDYRCAPPRPAGRQRGWGANQRGFPRRQNRALGCNRAKRTASVRVARTAPTAGSEEKERGEGATTPPERQKCVGSLAPSARHPPGLIPAKRPGSSQGGCRAPCTWLRSAGCTCPGDPSSTSASFAGTESAGSARSAGAAAPPAGYSCWRGRGGAGTLGTLGTCPTRFPARQR
jgi:hypothetical protein